MRRARSRLSHARTQSPGLAIRRWLAERRFDAQLAGHRDSFARSMWREAADAVGAEFDELAPLLFRFRRGEAVSHAVGQRTPFADPPSIELANIKSLSYSLLREAGLPVPEHVVVSHRDLATAVSFLEQAPVPVVVKPVHEGGGGTGVTGSIRSASQLKRAIANAGIRSRDVLVDRSVRGAHFRLLLLDGALLDVIKREPPVVVGDGSSTIEDLIRAEHERRLAAGVGETLKPLTVDLDCLFTLELQGLGVRSIPAHGAPVQVKSATNFGGRSESTTIREGIAPGLVEEARIAAATLGVRLAGVDILTTDPSVSTRESGGAILEVNPIPALSHHYNVAEPQSATRVAIPVVEAMLEESRRRGQRSVSTPPAEARRTLAS